MTNQTPAERAAAAAVRWFPATLILLAIAAPAMTWGTPYFQLMLSWGLALLLAAGTLAAARPNTGVIPSSISAAGFASIVMAVEVGLLLLLIPVRLLISHYAADDVPGWTYPYLNKRWLIALYGVSVTTFLVLPVAFRRAFAAADIRRTAVEEPARRTVSRVAGLLIVAGLVWFVAGPPWNVERHHRAIDFHEQVHLGPLQAIHKGHVPFIGAASTQYGPGSQLLTYAYMTATGRFNIVGYREATLAIHLTSLMALGLLAWWLIDLPAALMVIVLAMAFSPISFFSPQPDGTFQGAYGWGNSFRYLGALLIVPAAGLTAARVGVGLVSWRHALLGVAWGGAAWVSQENLSATLTASGMLLLLLLFTRTITLRQLAIVVLNMAGGFFLFWIPVLAYYAIHGEAIAFIGNYFRVARAVAMGFSNSWWSEGTETTTYRAFRLTPVFAVLVGFATLWDIRRLDSPGLLDRRRIRLLAFVSVLIASYMTALYRSDSMHYLNTLIALPFVLTLAFRDLPSWAASSWLGRGLLRVVVAVAAFWIFPLTALTDLYGSVVKPSLGRYAAAPPPAAVADTGRVPFQRATAYLSDEPRVAAGSVPMRQFLEEMSVIRELVGDRKTHLTGMGSVYTGIVYFIGDLLPAHVLLERETMIINSLLSQQMLTDLRRRMPEIECVMVREREMDEARMFLEAHPDAIVEQRPLAGAPIFILMTR